VVEAAHSDDPVAPGTDIVMLENSLTLKGRWAECFIDVIEAWSRKDGHRYIEQLLLFAKGGALGPALTSDGIHLNATGYRVWQEAIAQQVNRRSAAELLPTGS